MQNTPNKKRKKAFTLVELIIVITILAVLATIAFLSFNGYTKNSRDSVRLTNLSDVSKALEVYKVTTGTLPTPDDITGTGQILGVDLFQVGKVGDKNASLLKFDKTPLDPLTQNSYAYGVSMDRKYYQVAVTVENTTAGNNLMTHTYAATNNIAKVEGNYKGLLKFSTGSNQYIGNVPSLIFSTGGTYDLVLQDPYFVINNGKNLPYVVTSGDTTSNQVKAEVLASLGSTATSVTGVVITDFLTNADDIVAILGYPKDLVGVEVLGTEYYRQLDGSYEVAGVKFTKVVGSGMYHCGLTTLGGVMCWGYNSEGQLGNNNNENSPIPVDVVGLTSGIVDIQAGGTSACALNQSGGIMCWGSSEFGQLGNGTFSNSSIPVQVTGLTSGVTNFTIASNHACAILSSGSLMCWGYNSNGQLGNGTIVNSSIPVQVTGLTSGVVKVLAASNKTCAITSLGALKCWGQNGSNGALGRSSTSTNLTTPGDVTGYSSGTLKATITDGFGCALSTTGGVKCWGNNSFGQLGRGNTNLSTSPVQVTGLTSGVIDIDSQLNHSCVALSGSGVQCWGNNNQGQIGNGNTTNALSPVYVGTSTGFTTEKIILSQTASCVITSTKGIKCWGSNFSGNLGNGTNVNTPYPIDVEGFTSGVTSFAFANMGACAIGGDSLIKCWGPNGNGQLGDGTTTNSNIPVGILLE